MTWKSRIEAAGAIHHLLVREIERDTLFRDYAVRGNDGILLAEKKSETLKRTGIQP